MSFLTSQTNVRPTCLPDPIALPAWKRTMDIALCAIAFPCFFVVLLAISALLALTSRGPVFFAQERVGYLGRRFKLYKFRTMHCRADPHSHETHVAALVRSNAPMRKLDAVGDRRLVPGAWLIRALGLDELPQILNVLRGDMSIVGPRPCIPYEYEQYSPWQRTRFNAVPGLTGLWQVSGKNRTTFDEMIRLDIHYAQSRSLRLDVSIVLRTAPALWTQVRDLKPRHTGAPAPALAHDVRPGPAATLPT